jgi:hypothetical protein
MAPRKSKLSQVGENKPKLDLGKTLAAFDYRNRDYYNKLTDEEKKGYFPFVLMRFMSSAPDQGGLHEYHLQAVNDIINQDFWYLSDYPDLQHQLFCLLGIGKKQYHNWIAGAKKAPKNKITDIVKRMYPGANKQEMSMFLKMHDKQSFKELLQDQGIQDDEIKELLDNFAKIRPDGEE